MNQESCINNEIINLLLDISSAYYLIPNIEKFLDKVLKIINLNFNCLASSVFFLPPTCPGNEIFLVRISNNGNNFELNEYLTLQFKKIIDLNFNNFSSKKTLLVNKDTVAYLFPFFFNKNIIAILILLMPEDNSVKKDLCFKYLDNFISAALIANYIIYDKNIKLQNFHTNNFFISKLSLKRIFEWRLEEIINSFLDSDISNNGLYREIISQTEKALIETTLKKSGYNKSITAKILGLNRSTLQRKIKELNIN